MIPNVVRGNGFRGALDYVFDTQSQRQGESLKEPAIIDSNMAGQTARALATEFGVVRQLNRRCKNPVWHVSLAFAIGEVPTDEQLERIPALFIDKVGAQAGDGEQGMTSEQNQWVAVIHRDKAHLHLHLLLNRIRYDGQVCYCKWDKNRAQAACRELEQELGLVAVKGDSPRLFLDGRLVARLEQDAERTGMVDPRLERYRRERQASLEATHARRDRPEAAEIRATAGSVSDGDPAGIAGEGVGSSTRDAEPATAPDPGLEQFKRQLERQSKRQLERQLLAGLDHLLSPAAGESRAPGDLQKRADHDLQRDRGGVQPVHSGVQGGEPAVESRKRQPERPNASAGGDGRQPAKPAPEARTVPVKAPVRRSKAPIDYER